MARLRIGTRRTKKTGQVRCPECQALVPAGLLRELLRAGLDRGTWMCAMCAQQKVSQADVS